MPEQFIRADRVHEADLHLYKHWRTDADGVEWLERVDADEDDQDGKPFSAIHGVTDELTLFRRFCDWLRGSNG